MATPNEEENGNVNQTTDTETEQGKDTVISGVKSTDTSPAKATVKFQAQGIDDPAQAKSTVIAEAKDTDDATPAKGTLIHESKGIDDKSQSGAVDEVSQGKSTVLSQAKGIDEESRAKDTVLSHAQGVDDASQGKGTVISQAQGTEISQSGSIHVSQVKSLDQFTASTGTADENKQSYLSKTESSQTIKSVTLDRKRVVELKRVCIVGSGYWGTVIAKIIGNNITKIDTFNNKITLFVQDEIIEGKMLSDIINETRENIKYLPGHQLPENVIAESDVVEAAKDAHIIIFTIQQEYISQVCKALVGKIKPTAAGLCLTKGFQLSEDGNIDLYSEIITRQLKIQTSVLMGANLYEEIADGLFCEATLGCKDKLLAATLKDLIQNEHLCVSVVDDVDGVEVCGALRNIIACGVGFVDGMDMGRSAKAAVIRLGMLEMIKFVDTFYPGSKVSTFFESCGVTDLATSFLAGRNREISEKFVTTRRSIREFENEMLGGLALEGPLTARNLHFMLRERDLAHRYPLFTAVYKVYAGELEPSQFLDNVLGSPEHVNVRLLHLTW